MALQSQAWHAGQVYWGPPDQALKEAAAVVSDLETSRYNTDEGRPELRAALQAKIEKENGLQGVRALPAALHSLTKTSIARSSVWVWFW